MNAADERSPSKPAIPQSQSYVTPPYTPPIVVDPRGGVRPR